MLVVVSALHTFAAADDYVGIEVHLTCAKLRFYNFQTNIILGELYLMPDDFEPLRNHIFHLSILSISSTKIYLV